MSNDHKPLAAALPDIESWSKGYKSGYARAVADHAARQPVGEPVRVSGDMVDGELSVASAIDQVVELFPSADRAALRTLAACFTHHSIYRYAAPPAQAVDLTYSLDADPAGIRARVADVITGTLMVATQGHTPPPAGHWAQPFWQAARHDAARSLNVTLRLRELVAASKYMRDRVVETRGVKCMDDLDYAIDEAEKALKDNQVVGNG